MIRKFLLAAALSVASIFAFAQPYYPSTGGVSATSVTSACTNATSVLYNAATPCSANLTFDGTKVTIGNSTSAGLTLGVGTASTTSINFGTVNTGIWTAAATSNVTIAVGGSSIWSVGSTHSPVASNFGAGFSSWNSGNGTTIFGTNAGSGNTDRAADPINFYAGVGTGSGAGSSFGFYATSAEGSGTTLQTYAEKARIYGTAGQGLAITAGTAANNTPRALSISQTWTDGTSSNIGIVGNFDMGATGTATGRLLSLQAGAAGTTEVFGISQDGSVITASFANTVNGYQLSGVIAISGLSPSIASGGCTSPTVTNTNGTAHFTIDVGTSCLGSQPVVFTLPAATTGWNCYARNVTNGATSAPAQTGAISTTAVTITNFVRTTGVAGAWTDGDDVVVSCLGG